MARLFQPEGKINVRVWGARGDVFQVVHHFGNSPFFWGGGGGIDGKVQSVRINNTQFNPSANQSC